MRAPMNITKYDRMTNPGVWLEDYRLACHMEGTKDDPLILSLIHI